MNEGSIFIVSNDDGIARALQITLAAKGYRVRNTRNIDDALPRIGSVQCDVVLFDGDSSPCTSTEACRKIRDCSDVSIVIMGSDSSPEARMAAMRAGADAYIGKPFGILDIFAMIRANLHTSRQRDAAYQVN